MCSSDLAIELATPPPTRAATPPAAEHREEEENVDEEIVMEPPPEAEEAPTRGADAPEATADAATREEAGSAPEEREAEAPPEPPSSGARSERTPSPLRALGAGGEENAPTSPQAATGVATSSGLFRQPICFRCCNDGSVTSDVSFVSYSII